MIRWIQIEGSICLEVSGKDSRRYLHNRLSNDISGLAVGACIKAAALNAQGRVEGVYVVLREAEERFILLADGGERGELIATLNRFIVADRVSIADQTPGIALVHISGDTSILRAHISGIDLGSIRILPYHRYEQGGIDVLAPKERLEDVLSFLHDHFGAPLSKADYYRLRWEAGVPVYPIELNQDVILTECGMRDAVSFSKGCYVGQEVIERSDAVGKLPRSLNRIQFSGVLELSAGAQIRTRQGEVLGKIVSFAGDVERGRTLAFAMLRASKCRPGDEVVVGISTEAEVPGRIV